MKRNLAFLLALVLIPAMSFAQDKGREDEKEQIEQVRAALEEKRYEIEVDWAIPLSGRSVNLTHGYSLEVRNDTVVAHLPFYGRAYSLPYGEGGGIHLEKPLKDYTQKEVVKRKSTQTVISFGVEERGDFIEFNLIVFENGSTSISMSSNRRAAMNYRGQLMPIVESKED